VVEYTKEASAVVRALKKIFADLKLFPERPLPVLPRMELNGVSSGDPEYQKPTHRRCSEPTMQAAIVAALNPHRPHPHHPHRLARLRCQATTPRCGRPRKSLCRRMSSTTPSTWRTISDSSCRQQPRRTTRRW
jgi:hypothetical protein